VPKNHPALHWNCLIDGCPGYIRAQELCKEHVTSWRAAQAGGMDRLEFLRTAPPSQAYRRLNAPTDCRVQQCSRPAERNIVVPLCTFHRNQWQEFNGSIRLSGKDFDSWLADQEPRASFGPCLASICPDLARSPLQLCEDHEKLYRTAGRPGGARLPTNWAAGPNAAASRSPSASPMSLRFGAGAEWPHLPPAQGRSACTA
jgi:hypothetical protein